MLNKKYFPSLGFIILSITVACSILFVNWALGPLGYEKASYEEKLGHQLAKEGKVKEASKHFLISAKITDDPISTSRRYRCVASTSRSTEDKIKYFKLALKYNPKNKNAIIGLNSFSKEITYFNRSKGGWSQGGSASAVVRVLEKNTTYEITYFTSSPKKVEHKVKVLIDDKVHKEQIIARGKKYIERVSLPEGRHTIDMSINDTFNPKKLGMSKDDRDLGVNFEIKKAVGDE